MTKAVAAPVDAERLVVDYLTTQLALHGQSVDVGVSPPPKWAAATKPFVQVASDGIPAAFYPVSAVTVIRVTAWCTTTTAAKALCGLAHGILLAHAGGGGIQSVAFGTGTLPARDKKTGAELASATVNMRVDYAVAS
jgi:hypothetical protein